MRRLALGFGTFALGLTLSFAVLPAHAQDAKPDEPKAQYPQTEILMYIWGPMIASKVNSDRGEVKSYISFHDLLSNLNGALMLHGRSQLDDDWSIVGDVFWAHLRADNQSRQVKLGPREQFVVDAQLKAAMDLWVVELNGGHKLFRFGSLFSRSEADPRHTMGEMYFGGRYYSFNPDINVAVETPGRNLETSIGQNQVWVDPVVGLRFGADLSRTSRLLVMGDVGGFNLGGYSSEFSWSQSTILSWDFAQNWRLHMGYRFLDFKRDFHSGLVHLQLRGPLIAVGYVF